MSRTGHGDLTRRLWLWLWQGWPGGVVVKSPLHLAVECPESIGMDAIDLLLQHRADVHARVGTEDDRATNRLLYESRLDVSRTPARPPGPRLTHPSLMLAGRVWPHATAQRGRLGQRVSRTAAHRAVSGQAGSQYA